MVSLHNHNHHYDCIRVAYYLYIKIGNVCSRRNLEINENWSDNWLKELKNTYLDKTCEFCKSGVVNEGIVVKIDSSENKTVFKFKSPAFLVKESSARDAGEEDLEEMS